MRILTEREGEKERERGIEKERERQGERERNRDVSGSCLKGHNAFAARNEECRANSDEKSLALFSLERLNS